MKKSEEIIDGMKRALTESNKFGVCCFTSEFVSEALALLKEQEPRVLTLDEIMEKTRDDVVYLEHMDGSLICQPAIPLGEPVWDKECLNFAAGWRTGGNYQKENYGETWRCWTSRPTDEQREATQWN